MIIAVIILSVLLILSIIYIFYIHIINIKKRNEQFLPSAKGKILDNYGFMLGVPRNGRKDKEYRSMLIEKLRWFVEK